MTHTFTPRGVCSRRMTVELEDGMAAAHGAELDGYIEKYAIGWQFARIPRVAAAIMRVAMYELLYMPETPSAVVINEAVKIAKHYEDDKVVSFLNGILGSFYRGELPEEAHK